jgi:hypothetical protein
MFSKGDKNFMKTQLNCDSFEIKNFEKTPEGYLKTWIVAGIPNHILNYGDRKETINKDSLFDKTSVNTAIGKPITLNHPPVAIDSRNYKEYIKGSILQEFSEGENGELVFSAIIYDSDLAKDIENGIIKYFSPGYSTDKELNADGVLEQKNRDYNHFSGLTSEFTPRAGENSKVLILGNEDSETTKEYNTETKDKTKAETETETTKAETTPKDKDERDNNTNTDMKTEIKNQIDSIRKEASLKAQLASKWQNVFVENGIYFNFDSELAEIKKQILSCYYNENIVKQLNTDALVDGFFINFQVQHDAGGIVSKSKINHDAKQEQNYDSALDDAMNTYEKTICNIK